MKLNINGSFCFQKTWIGVFLKNYFQVHTGMVGEKENALIMSSGRKRSQKWILPGCWECLKSLVANHVLWLEDRHSPVNWKPVESSHEKRRNERHTEHIPLSTWTLTGWCTQSATTAAPVLFLNRAETYYLPPNPLSRLPRWLSGGLPIQETLDTGVESCCDLV